MEEEKSGDPHIFWTPDLRCSKKNQLLHLKPCRCQTGKKILLSSLPRLKNTHSCAKGAGGKKRHQHARVAARAQMKHHRKPEPGLGEVVFPIQPMHFVAQQACIFPKPGLSKARSFHRASPASSTEKRLQNSPFFFVYFPSARKTKKNVFNSNQACHSQRQREG